MVPARSRRRAASTSCTATPAFTSAVTLPKTDTAAIDRMLNLNVNAVMKNVRDVIPHMIERGTGTSSSLARWRVMNAVPWEPVYSGSKWAITCFVQTMRRQLNQEGYPASARVSPGPVISALPLPTGPRRTSGRRRSPGSLIEPTEVSDAVLFMLTRPRNVTIRDIIVLPTNFDI